MERCVWSWKGEGFGSSRVREKRIEVDGEGSEKKDGRRRVGRVRVGRRRIGRRRVGRRRVWKEGGGLGGGGLSRAGLRRAGLEGGGLRRERGGGESKRITNLLNILRNG